MANRIIHTNLYSDSAFTLMCAVRSALAYCNLRRIDAHNADYCSIVRAPDNEITIEVEYSWHRNIFRRFEHNDQEVLNYFAWTTKELIRKCCGKFSINVNFKTIWKRNAKRPDIVDDGLKLNEASLGKFNVSDVYMFYELLRNRRFVDRKYKAKKLAEMRGEQRDPISTEQERIRREEEQTIKDKYAALINDNKYDAWGSTLNKLMQEESRKASERITAKYKKLSEEKVAALIAERDQKLAELNETLGLMIA